MKNILLVILVIVTTQVKAQFEKEIGFLVLQAVILISAHLLTQKILLMSLLRVLEIL